MNSKKLKYLSETKLIADDCAVLEIQNRGADDHDEIQEHLLKIQEFATEYKVTIRDVQKNTMKPEFAQLYHEMIETESGNGGYICLPARTGCGRCYGRKQEAWRLRTYERAA